MRTPEVGSRLAVAALVAANFVPVVGVVTLGWNISTLIVVYWLESAVVGVESVAKVLRAEGQDRPEDLPDLKLNGTPVSSMIGDPKRKIAGYLVFHYGFFWLVHGVFVMVLYAGIAASFRDVALALVGLAAYHAISYWRNYVRGGSPTWPSIRADPRSSSSHRVDPLRLSLPLPTHGVCGRRAPGSKSPALGWCWRTSFPWSGSSGWTGRSRRCSRSTGWRWAC